MVVAANVIVVRCGVLIGSVINLGRGLDTILARRNLNRIWDY